MEGVIKKRLASLKVGSPRGFRNVCVHPLYLEDAPVVEHLVLSQAMEAGLLTIREVDEAGRVHELVVENDSDMPVLILDGEELAGARQNRVLNTTVLIAGRFRTVIPVSCTEQGRWSSTSSAFKDSGVIMSPGLRKRKNHSVGKSLRMSSTFRSDQVDVWEGIAEMSRQASVCSSIGGMRDVFEAKRGDLEEYARHFGLVDGQQGILVTFAGRPAGLDIVPHAASYALLHEKLLRSYLMDAVLFAQDQEPSKPDSRAAQGFVAKILGCSVERYASVGLGWDLRLTGKRMLASALEHDNCLVHLAAFPSDGVVVGGSAFGMVQSRARASYRKNRQGPGGGV